MAGSRNFWDDTKFDYFVVFCWVGLASLFFLVVSFFAGEGSISSWCRTTGIVLACPVIVHGTLLALWHWKSRYKGRHSKLWGALLVLETTGWFKAVYIWRHVVPDRQGKGRYVNHDLREPVNSEPGLSTNG